MALYTSDDVGTVELGERRIAEAERQRPWLPIVFGIGVLTTAVLFFVGAWQRRWVADDGLIVLRTVRNMLVGNGPVFNMHERVETNTSAAWTFIVYFFSRISWARLEYVVLAIALALSVAAIVLAMLGAARLYGGSRLSLLLPAGALVYIALPPARDFATSGLETCLVIFWIGLLWLLMMRWATRDITRMELLFLTFVAGLGWLIRPEMVLVAAGALLVIGFGTTGWLLRIGLAAVAMFAPVTYQVWRMGYYALPFPNTAVAKEATGSSWGQGFTYLWNTAGPYWLLLPLGLLVLTALGVGRKPTVNTTVELRSARTVVGLMILCGLLLLAFVLKVGGDFMHGRMLLPPLFMLLLPVMVVPVRLDRGRRAWMVPATAWLVLVVWAVFVANASVASNKIGRSGIVDERAFYVRNSGHAHPVLAEDYLDYSGGWMRAMLRDIKYSPNGGLLINSPQFTHWDVVPPPLPIPPGGAGHTVYFLNLGMTSMNVPLHVKVLDPEGLAYPLAAHTDRVAEGRIGHDKSLPSDWLIADLGLVDRHPWMPPYLDEDWITEAHVALTCPATKDLLASYRGPLTIRRFGKNILHAFSYASYRIDRVPEYEIERCGLTPPTLKKPREN